MTNNIQGTPIRLSADFSRETLQARRDWHNIFKVMKGKNYNQEYFTQQDSVQTDEEIESFPDKQKLTEFSITKPALQQMLKELL